MIIKINIKSLLIKLITENQCDINLHFTVSKKENVSIVGKSYGRDNPTTKELFYVICLHSRQVIKRNMKIALKKFGG